MIRKNSMLSIFLLALTACGSADQVPEGYTERDGELTLDNGEKARLKGEWLGDVLTEANREMQQLAILETRLEIDLLPLKQEAWRTKQLACDLSKKSNAGLRQVSFQHMHPFLITPMLPRWDSPCSEAGRGELSVAELCSLIDSRIDFASRIRNSAPTSPLDGSDTRQAASQLLWAYTWISAQLTNVKQEMKCIRFPHTP